MIRDPSDGTVRENLIAGLSPVIDTGTSGLPIGKAKAEYLARLEASREWVKNWHHRKALESNNGDSIETARDQSRSHQDSPPGR